MSLKILIVDDDTSKIGLIKDAVLESRVVLDEEIEYCSGLQEALAHLQKKRYDLVLLDVILPSKMGDRMIRTGGTSILKAIKEMDRVKKPLCVVGITAYKESLEQCEDEFRRELCSLIKYQRDSDEWRQQIIRKVLWLHKAKNNLLEEERNVRTYEYDYAILTAVDDELQAVLELPLDWEQYRIPYDNSVYYISYKEVNGKTIRFVVGRSRIMGMPAAATLASKMISFFKPRYVVMVGITGGRKGEVNAGDIIAASDSWDYGSGKWKSVGEDGECEFFPDPDHILVSSNIYPIFMQNYDDLLREIRVAWNKKTHQKVEKDNHIHVGPLASGSAVVQNKDILHKYIEPHARKVLGIDMETYGVYYACKEAFQPLPEFLSIKAVSDFADIHKNDDAHDYCAYVSANFFYELVVRGILR